jgi:hypothetical protein
VLLLSQAVRVHTADLAADGDDAHLPIDSRPAAAASPGCSAMVPGLFAKTHAAAAAFERRLTFGNRPSSTIELDRLRAPAASPRGENPPPSFAIGQSPIARRPDGNCQHFVRHINPSKANNEEGNADQRAAARREPHRDC